MDALEEDPSRFGISRQKPNAVTEKQQPINNTASAIVGSYQLDELSIGVFEDTKYTGHKKQSIKAESIFQGFQIPEGMRILDVGCGNGETTFKSISISDASVLPPYIRSRNSFVV